MSRGQWIFFSLITLGAAGVFGFYAPQVLEFLFHQLQNWTGRQEAGVFQTNFLSVAASSLLGLIAGGTIGRIFIGIGDRISHAWDRMDTGDKVTIFVGVFAGLIASMPFLLLLNSLALGVYIPFAVIGLTLGFAAVSVFALRSMDEILPWSRGKGPSKRKGIKILDTNILIDGRIYDIARSGFIEGQLYIPGFVLEELQYIADSHDPLRRQRGRRGLDVLRHLQADFSVEVRTQDKQAPDLGDGVDARLVRLARAIGADIVTNDFNLNRVASVQEVKVLNLNDLALAIRPNLLPSEKLELSIVREGNQPGQGVGYLEDGTMVVVENGRAHMGETLEVVVTQVIQTERGKMLFAAVEGEPTDDVRRGRGGGR